jgi:hypothetical protein
LIDRLCQMLSQYLSQKDELEENVNSFDKKLKEFDLKLLEARK